MNKHVIDQSKWSWSACEACLGMGYTLSNGEPVSSCAAPSRYLFRVSLRIPGTVGRAITSYGGGIVFDYKPCTVCLGTALHIEVDALDMLCTVCVDNEEFLRESGMLGTLAPLAATQENLRDLLDNGAPVLLDPAEVMALYNAYLAICFDAQRRLAMTTMVQQ